MGGQLVEFLVAAYHRARRHDDAVRIAWEEFARDPCLGGYVRLEKSADRAKAWASWREKALAQLRTAPRPSGRVSAQRFWATDYQTLIVEIFLHEGDTAAALSEARSGGCRRDIWMKLGRACEQDLPRDAAAIFRESIEAVIGRMNNPAYDEAAGLARKIRVLMARAGQADEFAAWLAALRAKHRAKRNLMARLVDCEDDQN